MRMYDNGSTYTSTKKASGLGMTNMAQRIASLNGDMTVDTEEGFAIVIRIPKRN